PLRHPLLSTPPPTAATYPLSLHDALPISLELADQPARLERARLRHPLRQRGEELQDVHVVLDDVPDTGAKHLERHLAPAVLEARSEEHTSELQSPYDLVCRLLLEKKKQHN